ncbi:MAG TPA: G1 family glutamic endopeptidase [Gaiellaceae bacterium]|nr:G1 family glutamic endopeptidase [Gaiellaceae bacterium]
MSRRYLSVAIVGVLAAVAALSATGGAASSIRHAPNHKITNSTSTNWSGYAVTGGRYTQVSSSWTVPSVSCAGTAYSSFWVGLDGDTSGTVEQTGTDSDCSGSTPQYYAWYEMYPKFPSNFSNPVRPGDKMSASVTTNGSGSFTLTISDGTAWSRTVTARLKSAKLASAEVIAEAPSSSGGVLPLANFGSVNFSGATANGALLTASTPGIDPITMQSGSTVKAQPSNFTSAGSFSVAWKHS